VSYSHNLICEKKRGGVNRVCDLNQHMNWEIHSVFQLHFEIFRTIASFIKISSGHSLIIKLIFVKFFRTI
jgi:hypothetical protein